MTPSPWIVLLTFVRVTPPTFCWMNAAPPLDAVVPRFTVPAPCKVAARAEALPNERYPFWPLPPLRLIVPALLIVPSSTVVELLLAVKALPDAMVTAPAAVLPSSVVVAADSIAPPPLVLSVPPTTPVLNRLITLPVPLAVRFPPPLLTVVVPNARVPPLVASSRPVLVVPPEPFITSCNPVTFASMTPAVLLTTTRPPLPMTPLP